MMNNKNDNSNNIHHHHYHHHHNKQETHTKTNSKSRKTTELKPYNEKSNVSSAISYTPQLHNTIDHMLVWNFRNKNDGVDDAITTEMKTTMIDDVCC